MKGKMKGNMKKFNEVQEIQLRLMEIASFNDFDGEKVVKSLRENSNLWMGVIVDSAFYTSGEGLRGGVNLIKLRDITSGFWNVDTIFITPMPLKEEELEDLAKTWGADEVVWLSGKESCDALGSWSMDKERNNKQVLRVWWD